MPGIANLVIYRGDDFRQGFTFMQAGTVLPMPTTGWLAQIRPIIDGTVSVVLTIDASAGASGLIVVSLTGAQTTVLDSGVWDLQATVNGQVTTWISGVVVVSKDVTHA